MPIFKPIFFSYWCRTFIRKIVYMAFMHLTCRRLTDFIMVVLYKMSVKTQKYQGVFLLWPFNIAENNTNLRIRQTISQCKVNKGEKMDIKSSNHLNLLKTEFIFIVVVYFAKKFPFHLFRHVKCNSMKKKQKMKSKNIAMWNNTWMLHRIYDANGAERKSAGCVCDETKRIHTSIMCVTETEWSEM